MAYYGSRSTIGQRTALDPLSGKTFTIDKNSTYDDWLNKLKSMYSDSEINLQKKKILNIQRDNTQYRAIRAELKAKGITSLDEFQTVKYKDKKRYKALVS